MVLENALSQLQGHFPVNSLHVPFIFVGYNSIICIKHLYSQQCFRWAADIAHHSSLPGVEKLFVIARSKLSNP